MTPWELLEQSGILNFVANNYWLHHWIIPLGVILAGLCVFLGVVVVGILIVQESRRQRRGE